MCEPDTTLSVKYEPQFVQRHFRLTSGTSPFPIATISVPDFSLTTARLAPDNQPVVSQTAPGREISQATSPTLDDLPGAFGRGFVVQWIGRIVYHLAVVPRPATLGGDDLGTDGDGLRGFFRGLCSGGRAVTMLVMEGNFGISHASLFRRAGEQRRSVGYLPKRLQMRDSGLFGRPRSHDPLLAIWLGWPQSHRRGRVE
jgi:hypothetical protein